MPKPSSAVVRTHVVLVPGFGGFDALGQLEYYAGTTQLFQKWRSDQTSGSPRSNTVIHYFDNLPTAAVATRAKALQRFLWKRMARNEIQAGEGIALVGHSTGGLDIRQLLWTLMQTPQTQGAVDGGGDDATLVSNRELLARLKRVVFLSVPQWGTNIADWVRGHRLLFDASIQALNGGLNAARVRPLDKLEQWLVGLPAGDFFTAVRDALAETNDAELRDDALGAADARESYAALELWLRHIGSDFMAIGDLSTQHPGGENPSPGQFDEARRGHELGLWKEHGVQSRSYATVGANPFAKDSVAHGKPFVLWQPWTSPESGLRDGSRAQTDLAYRWCYRACSGGAFKGRPDAQATELETGNVRTVGSWENDGIVNTASMLWPDGAQTKLVDGDHGDIIGHYKLVPAAEGEVARGRRYHTYDLLKSSSGFTDSTFEKVWRDVFDFCTG